MPTALTVPSGLPITTRAPKIESIVVILKIIGEKILTLNSHKSLVWQAPFQFQTEHSFMPIINDIVRLQSWWFIPAFSNSIPPSPSSTPSTEGISLYHMKSSRSSLPSSSATPNECQTSIRFLLSTHPNDPIHQGCTTRINYPLRPLPLQNQVNNDRIYTYFQPRSSQCMLMICA